AEILEVPPGRLDGPAGILERRRRRQHEHLVGAGRLQQGGVELAAAVPPLGPADEGQGARRVVVHDQRAYPPEFRVRRRCPPGTMAGCSSASPKRPSGLLSTPQRRPGRCSTITLGRDRKSTRLNSS